MARDRFQIVINRSRQTDEETISKHDRILGQPVLTELPNDYRQVGEAIKLGDPLLTSANNPLVGRYRNMATRLVDAARRDQQESDGAAEAVVARNF